MNDELTVEGSLGIAVSSCSTTSRDDAEPSRKTAISNARKALNNEHIWTPTVRLTLACLSEGFARRTPVNSERCSDLPFANAANSSSSLTPRIC